MTLATDFACDLGHEEFQILNLPYLHNIWLDRKKNKYNRVNSLDGLIFY